MPAQAGQIYNAPNGSPSSVGTQLRTFYNHKKALTEAAKEAYFGQLADTVGMPAHMGKTIKKYVYHPIIDDRNINSQGIDASGATIANGNLYGSSKDIGTISGKMPALSENGGRVNRVGMTRSVIEGTIAKYGIFEDYTEESRVFDTDEKLESHMTTEMVKAANQITEAQLQIDLLNAASVRYVGNATMDSEISGEAGEVDIVEYIDLVKLRILLDNNRTPKNTKIIAGSRMIDTKVIQAARYMYVGSEMLTTLMKMKDFHNEKAFIPVEQYANAGNIARGEQGAIAGFRIIVVPEMMHWAGAGATATAANGGYSASNGKYDIFPMLVVGEESFMTIGFQTGGKTTKFKTYHKKPSDNHTSDEPYGETGFMSMKWYYGFLPQRTERLQVIKTVAEI